MVDLLSLPINAKRILLVEENVALVQQMAALLRQEGYEVENAYNLGDALAASHDRFSAALVNTTMKDREGRSILEHIRDHPTFSGLPILALNDLPTTPDGSGPRSAVLLSRVQQLVGKGRVGNIQQILSAAAPARPVGPPRAAQPTQEMEVVRDEDPTERRPPLEAMRLAAHRTLSDLARSISSVLDLNQVLNQVVEAATTLTGAEEGMLLLPDEEDKSLYLRAMKNVDEAKARNFRIKSDDSVIGAVYRSGEPTLASDRGLLRVKTEYFVKSLLYVPLRYKGQTIGVLGVNNQRSGRRFSQTDQELLLDLAAHAAIAIENARLYEAGQLQNRRLQILVETGMAVNSTLALPDVLLNISRQILKAFDVNACLIKQRDPSSSDRQQLANGKQTALLTENELRALAHSWQAAWRVDRGPKFVLDTRPALKQAIAQSSSYIVTRDQPANRAETELKLLEASGAERMLVLSVRVNNQSSFGAVELYYRGPIPPSTPELRARVRSLAVEITALLKPISEARPPNDVFVKAQQILEATKAQWMTLAVMTGENQMARILQYGSAVFLDGPRPEDLLLPPQTQPVFQDRKPVNFHMRQPNLAVPIRELMAAYGAEALLCLPLTIKGKVFGTFLIYSTSEARFFRQDEIGLAQALIAQAATAIENARLYRELEQSLRDLRQAQTGMVQAARLSTMGELAAVVAHQINNPLTTVIGESEMLVQDLKPDDPIRPSIEAIFRSGQRAKAVVQRLLSTARRSTDDRAMWLDVHQTIQNTLDLITTHIERNRVKIEVDLDKSVPSYILALPGHLEDVWLNLLMNGRDALTGIPNAALGILTRRAAGTLDVMVWDNGPGIPADVRETIFEPFFTTKPQGQGTGLGLYICKQIVEKCGGKISVDTAVGQGACFRVTLPVVEHRPISG